MPAGLQQEKVEVRAVVVVGGKVEGAIVADDRGGGKEEIPRDTEAPWAGGVGVVGGSGGEMRGREANWPRIMGFRSVRVALLCAVVVALSLGGGKLGAEAIKGSDLTKPFECDKNSDYGMWYRYTCVCASMQANDVGIYWEPAVNMSIGVTCPGPNQAVFGRMAFGNKWLESVGYSSWVTELMRCARQPYRGDGRQLCYISNIRGRYKELFVGNGYVPPGGKVNGRPWNWNPEPPYIGNNWRSWAWDEKPY
ncbi:unnamed protein product [Closterium sp. Naga37s-1]|nr:unnamed protein product [Closterium sp. Naga37s-1]